jgi:hypothetical protein
MLCPLGHALLLFERMLCSAPLWAMLCSSLSVCYALAPGAYAIDQEVTVTAVGKLPRLHPCTVCSIGLTAWLPPNASPLINADN